MQTYENYWQAIQAIAELHPVEIGAGFLSTLWDEENDCVVYRVKLTSGEIYHVTGYMHSEGADWGIKRYS